MRDFVYEQSHVGYDEQYPDGGIKCKNYELCCRILPDWWYDCKGCYLCIGCDVMFGPWCGGKGILNIVDNHECPICLDNNIRSISFPKCNHMVCIDCFKKCWGFEVTMPPEPIFPYPELEEDYDEDPSNTKWDEYPAILNFKYRSDLWANQRDRQIDETEHLRRCPLCRS